MVPTAHVVSLFAAQSVAASNEGQDTEPELPCVVQRLGIEQYGSKYHTELLAIANSASPAHLSASTETSGLKREGQ